MGRRTEDSQRYTFFCIFLLLDIFSIFPISDKVASLLLYANYLREVYPFQTVLFRGDFLQARKPEGCLPLLNKKGDIFGWVGPWFLSVPETFYKFPEGRLLIDLRMEECQILNIFSYFSWKFRWSPAQYKALNTYKKLFLGAFSPCMS